MLSQIKAIDINVTGDAPWMVHLYSIQHLTYSIPHLVSSAGRVVRSTKCSSLGGSPWQCHRARRQRAIGRPKTRKSVVSSFLPAYLPTYLPSYLVFTTCNPLPATCYHLLPPATTCCHRLPPATTCYRLLPPTTTCYHPLPPTTTYYYYY